MSESTPELKKKGLCIGSQTELFVCAGYLNLQENEWIKITLCKKSFSIEQLKYHNPLAIDKKSATV